ncbi:MAG: histidinol-phosphatase, partial [Calditrichaeota bacterium]|nr:histidinol-phosphatase [Calditrichota bacterium]
MDKKQISKILTEMALLMEIKGDNPFKIRAHENAARILDGLGENLAELAAAGKLTGIKGIGQGMADKITTLLSDQPLEEYDRLKEAIPAG